jgi:hypothetical protein
VWLEAQHETKLAGNPASSKVYTSKKQYGVLIILEHSVAE